MKRDIPRVIVHLLSVTALALSLGGESLSAQQAEWAVVPEPPAQLLAEQRRLTAALDALKPQRPGVVDAYIVVDALDGDPVFNREAREAGRVLANRFDAAGRTIVLADDEGSSKADAPASPETLELALARVAELMDRNEDVLVLYSTSHGEPGEGLVYRDSQRGGGAISPARLSDMLDSLQIKNRLLILQACFSGQFVPILKDPNTIIVTAAAADRSSFGCQAGNDWTYFGDALINDAFRQPLPLDVQLERARALISAAEDRDGLTPSNPQVEVGDQASQWLSKLDAREPNSTSSPIGQSVLGLAK